MPDIPIGPLGPAGLIVGAIARYGFRGSSAPTPRQDPSIYGARMGGTRTGPIVVAQADPVPYTPPSPGGEPEPFTPENPVAVPDLPEPGAPSPLGDFLAGGGTLQDWCAQNPADCAPRSPPPPPPIRDNAENYRPDPSPWFDQGIWGTAPGDLGDSDPGINRDPRAWPPPTRKISIGFVADIGQPDFPVPFGLWGIPNAVITRAAKEIARRIGGVLKKGRRIPVDRPRGVGDPWKIPPDIRITPIPQEEIDNFPGPVLDPAVIIHPFPVFPSTTTEPQGPPEPIRQPAPVVVPQPAPVPRTIPAPSQPLPAPTSPPTPAPTMPPAPAPAPVTVAGPGGYWPGWWSILAPVVVPGVIGILQRYLETRHGGPDIVVNLPPTQPVAPPITPPRLDPVIPPVLDPVTQPLTQFVGTGVSWPSTPGARARTRRCHCEKCKPRKKGKPRDCAQRGNLQWTSGPKKGKPAGSRCVDFK